MNSQAVKVFVSYSHKDEDLRDRLAQHLKHLERQGNPLEWHDYTIMPGSDWHREIDFHLNSADIILLMVSTDFINSDYVWGSEIQGAMQRHETGEAVVIPIVLRPTDWQDTPLSRLPVLPKSAKPITQWADQDEAFLDVVHGIESAVKYFHEARKQQRVEMRQVGEAVPASERQPASAGQEFWNKADRVAVVTAGGVALGGAIAQVPGAVIGGVLAATYGWYISFAKTKSVRNS